MHSLNLFSTHNSHKPTYTSNKRLMQRVRAFLYIYAHRYRIAVIGDRSVNSDSASRRRGQYESPLPTLDSKQTLHCFENNIVLSIFLNLQFLHPKTILLEKI